LLFRRDVDRRARLIGATRIAIATALTALACAATPYGFAMIKHVPEVRRASVGIINEWQHPGFASAGQGVSLAVMIAGLGIALVSWRAGRHHIAVALLLLAALTWSAIRFAPMLGVVMIPEVALLLGRAKARPFMLRRILALGLALITIATVVGLPHFGTVGPEESARLVRELPPRAVVVNDYLAGNAVILLRPDARVSVDGRNDMYGRATVIRMIDLLRDRPGTAQAMDEAGVTAVLAYSYARCW
jgi:hypothetical protein